jgi:arylsulfatase
MVVLDDLGFGQLGCFGADLATPHIDALAADGLRYQRFHVTALCSPTRASLLTGRNHHAVGMGFLPDVPISFPGYNGRIPRTAATLPRILRDAGYNTFAVGKWHLTPRWEVSASGPFDRWPLGLGFERWYGFHGGDTNHWAPELTRDNGYADAPREPGSGYHLTEDLADRAIAFVQDQQQATPGKPFFLWFATGAMHAPHHVAPEWWEPYRGRFDDGWEAWRERTFARQQHLGIVPAGTTLPERPPWVKPWHECSADERRLYARMMEVYAGFLTHTDAQLGRLFAHLETLGLADDTIVMLCSDNGTSAEGGPTGSLNEHRFTHDRLDDLADTVARIDDLGGPRAYNHYPWGWAWAGNTPLRLWKRYTWLGGVRTPLIVRWRAGIEARNEVRSQFCHAVDVMPTLLDAIGVTPPETIDGHAQQPLDGRSLVPTFTDAGAPSPRRTQYFEMLGSRAIYHDGWKATTDHVGGQMSIERELLEGSNDFATDRWSLFHLDDDFSEAHDRAGEHPDVLRALVDLWWAEAGRNAVLPLDDTFTGRAAALEPAPWGVHARVTYRPGGGPVAEDTMPPLGAGFRLHAHLHVGEAAPADGVVVALGDWNNGFALYLRDGCAAFAINLFGTLHRADASHALTPGDHVVTVHYRRERAGGGPLTLAVDGQEVASTAIPHDLPFRWQVAGAGLLVGRDRGLPVDERYSPPAPCTATIDRVVIESTVLAAPDAGAVVRAALAHE